MNEHVHPIFKQVLDTMIKPSVTHRYTERVVGRVVLVSCSCGAQRQFVRENALARAAKVRAWKRTHESEGVSKP